jgi:hypothetical protein
MATIGAPKRCLQWNVSLNLDLSVPLRNQLMLIISFAATGFSESFPGIKPHLLTLTSNFTIPFYRDIILMMGICSVSKKSCSNILKGGPGNAIAIVVGGAAESLSAHPGTADLTLRKRCFRMRYDCTVEQC